MKSRTSGTISSHLYNFPGKAAEIMDFMRAAARGILFLLIGKFYCR